MPRSLDSLCALIKQQLIHPLEAQQLQGVLPEGRVYEDPEFPTVESMLRELLARDPGGLVSDRKPENRLVVACHHHALLLTSILRSWGIPTVMRAGFAKYFLKDHGVVFGHVICDVWDEDKQRWMLVDPDRQKVDFSKKLFEFAPESWRNLRAGKLNPDIYTALMMRGPYAILLVMTMDLTSLLAMETPYLEPLPILENRIVSAADLSSGELRVLDSLAVFMMNPIPNLDEISQMQIHYDFLHFDHDSLRSANFLEMIYTLAQIEK
jgi:hypothetical protein